jgi:hypothetical protein
MREKSRGLQNHLKHGDARTGQVAKLHNLWRDILKRCSNKNDSRYGGRGITVCDEWKNDYVLFKTWILSQGWTDNCGLTIDRIDNDGIYSPDNCKLSTRKEQARNRRTSMKITMRGELKTVAEWSEILDIPYGILYYQYVTKKKHFEVVD